MTYTVQPPVQVTAVSDSKGNNTRETNADTGSNLQERLADVVERLNDHMRQMQRSLRFSVDDYSGRIVVKVVDKDTEEVIRQIPSDEMLAIMKHISEFDGLIFDGKA